MFYTKIEEIYYNKEKHASDQSKWEDKGKSMVKERYKISRDSHRKKKRTFYKVRLLPIEL